MQIDPRRGRVTVTRPTERGEDRALHGLTRTLIANMVEGVTSGFEKKLEIQGVGYRATLAGLRISSCGRLLALGADRAAGGHLVRGADPDAGRRPRHRQAGRRPDRRRDSQDAVRRSRTRARASATRASRFAGRSGSGHEGSGTTRRLRSDERAVRRVTAACAARSAAPPSVRACSCSASNRGVFAQLDRRRRRPHARRRVVARPAEVVQGRQVGPGRRGRQAARRRAPRRPASRLSSSTAAATCITVASRRSPTARAKED